MRAADCRRSRIVAELLQGIRAGFKRFFHIHDYKVVKQRMANLKYDGRNAGKGLVMVWWCGCGSHCAEIRSAGDAEEIDATFEEIDATFEEIDATFALALIDEDT
jgi:hypothetical protein